MSENLAARLQAQIDAGALEALREFEAASAAKGMDALSSAAGVVIEAIEEYAAWLNACTALMNEPPRQPRHRRKHTGRLHKLRR